MDKATLRDAIIGRLESERALLIAAAKSSTEEATSEENRPEGTHDMRGQLAAYLAAGQSKIADAVARAIEAYRRMPVIAFPEGTPIAAGALVTLESMGAKSIYLVGPAHGGMELEIDKVRVTVITIASPLGRKLLGRSVGDRLHLGGEIGSHAGVVARIE